MVGEARRLTARLPLTGRGVLATGVSRRAGLGYAIANRLEELGASVFRHGWTAGSMPLGRWGRPEDAGAPRRLACTDEAGWITGQVIDSEGGFVRHRSQ